MFQFISQHCLASEQLFGLKLDGASSILYIFLSCKYGFTHLNFQIEASFSNSLALYRLDTLFDYGNNLEDIKAVNLINEYYSYLMYEVQPKMQEVNEERKERGDLTYPYLIPRWIPNGIQT